MTNPSEDYTSRGFLTAAAALAILLAVSFIPPITAGGLKLRRASIVADVIEHSDKQSTTKEELPPEIDVKEFEVDLEQVAEKVAQTTASASPTGEATSASWDGFQELLPDTEEPMSESVAYHKPKSSQHLPAVDYSNILPADSLITHIENFATENSALERLYTKLLTGKPVRIAFMGDSFVEGDILTADLRELLQDTYSGGGAGFAPMASPFTSYRQTIKTTSKGWTPYNIMQRKTTPEPLAGDFFVSGWVAKGSDGASTRWEMTTRRRHLDKCQRARLLFIARQDTEISVTINDGEAHNFSFAANDIVRQIVVENDSIASLEMTLLSGGDGFTGYGAEFDGRDGVTLDNLSIRSNNGQAMFWTNPSVNAQINTMRNYDLVILQYGLNIMQAERSNYSLYAEQVEKMIRFVESCFPEAAVLVMGVSDRSQRNENGIEPMTVAVDLSRWQRQAAESCGASFWNTYEAMQKLGGMKEFVANGWAGKDYTHINYAGGKRIATSLYHALLAGAEQYAVAALKSLEPAEPVLSEQLTFDPVMPKIELKTSSEITVSAIQRDSTTTNNLQ